MLGVMEVRVTLNSDPGYPNGLRLVLALHWEAKSIWIERAGVYLTCGQLLTGLSKTGKLMVFNSEPNALTSTIGERSLLNHDETTTHHWEK